MDSSDVRKIIGLVSPGRYRKIQCREYPPNKRYLIKPPQAKIDESEGSLRDKFYDLSTDGNGFILPNFGTSTEDKNVIFLGGSTTECVWNKEMLRWPNLVAKIYNSFPSIPFRINTINSGVWGNTTAQSINLLFNKLIPLKPHSVCLMHNINDLVLMIHEADYWQAHTPSRKILIRSEWDAISTSKIRTMYLRKKWNKLKKVLRTPFKKTNEPDEFKEIRKKPSLLDPHEYSKLFSDNLRIFITICRIKNIHPVLLTQGNRMKKNPDKEIAQHVNIMMRDKGLSYEQVQIYYENLNDCIRQVCKNEQVSCIDLDKLIPKTGEYMFDSVHFTDKGCEYVAQVIAEQLQSQFSK